jgi:GNAT superfamily N-acetyltransferase
VDLVARLHDAHVRRVRGLDAMVRLPDVDLDEDPDVLVADDGEAVALVEAQHTDPGSPAGLWVEEDVVRVQVRCSSAADPSALSALLVRAHEAVPVHGAAHLSVVARDVLLVGALLRAGYAAGSVLALGRPDPTAGQAGGSESGQQGRWNVGAVVVRPATSHDLEGVVAAGAAVQVFDGVAGVLPHRPDAAAVLRGQLAESLAEHPGWCWVAERDDDVVGVCQVHPPGADLWATGWVADEGPTAYLALLHVTATERGSGLGRALVSAAHAGAAAAGVRHVVLYHGASNPLSVPFWGRAGYRPLVGGWLRQER